MQEEIVPIETTNAPHGALIHREDGSVALPVTETLPAKSEEAMQASVEPLPDELEPVVKTILKARHSAYSVLQLVLLIGFLAGALLLTYWFLPRPVEVGELDMRVVGDKLPTPTGTMAVLASEAGKLFQAKKYAECARLVFDKPTALATPWIANLFCETIYEIPFDQNWKEYSKAAFHSLAEMKKNKPDDVRWPLQELKLKSRILLKRGDFRLGAEDPSRQRAIAIQLVSIDSVRRLDRRTGRQNRVIIDLLEAKFLTASWLLSGFAQGYPDDLGDIGVEEREKAYQIAKRYDNQDFLELRREIVRKILVGDSMMNSYFFNGKSRYSKRYLEEELMAIQSRLSQGEPE